VIESYPEVITVIQHSDLLLSCSARGAPRPQVTWFRDKLVMSHQLLLQLMFRSLAYLLIHSLAS